MVWTDHRPPNRPSPHSASDFNRPGACTLAPEPACLLAPWTLAYAIALPAMNKITPIITNISVCLFTERSPSQAEDLGRPASGLLPAAAPLEGTTRTRTGT